jgi:acylphosphatase
MQETKKLNVYGRVQGVAYRLSAQRAALANHITGTVQNLPDGSVQIIATGEIFPLQQFIDWCRKGPSRADVESVKVEDLPLQRFSRFSII